MLLGPLDQGVGGGGGADSHIKGVEVLVVSLRGAISDFGIT